jgi:Holliday junction resolvase RusA-like endonuclease
MYQSDFIPIKPISINACFQGRRFRTKDFKKWQELVIHTLPKGIEKGEKIELAISVHLKSPLRSDLDNYAKPIIDCCVKRGLMKDDRYVFRIKLEKIKADKEGFEVNIKSYE